VRGQRKMDKENNLINFAPKKWETCVISLRQPVSHSIKCFQLTIRGRCGSRVTRLGEFSPIESLFTLGSFVKNYRRSTNNWATYLNGKSYALIISKKWIGRHFGRLFHKRIWSPWLRASRERFWRSTRMLSRRPNSPRVTTRVARFFSVQTYQNGEIYQIIHNGHTFYQMAVKNLQHWHCNYSTGVETKLSLSLSLSLRTYKIYEN
jgi:hypothetical protein